ncbi:hypothetical protein [Streptomyces sp. NPDC059166]|uniref:hypothetical protein n=1 Tax=Streptomyces sp. NPDC059166 TaxID=3346752 RepID=UPI00368A7487
MRLVTYPRAVQASRPDHPVGIEGQMLRLVGDAAGEALTRTVTQTAVRVAGDGEAVTLG